MASMEYEAENRSYAEEPRYDRDRSRSPRPSHRERGDSRDRVRSASPNGRMDSRGPPPESRGNGSEDKDSGARNPGSNLFVTGIHPRLSESDVARLFEKYGEVEKASIMLDPHTKESRGFGFVKMVTSDQADAAKEGLQGENIEGRTLSIEKARRARPRTPTPGKYFGPPKREDEFRGPPQGRFDRDYRDDRRRGGYGGGYGGGREDSYRGGGYSRHESRYESRYDRDSRGGGGGDRYYGDRRGPRDDYDRGDSRGDSRGGDRYNSRDDRYGGRGGGSGGGSGYDRDSGRSRDTGYNESGSRDAGGRSSDARYDDRQSRR